LLRWIPRDRLKIRWLSLVVLGALLPLFLWSRSGGALEDGRGPFRPDGLRAASRDHLALCVEAIAGATVDSNLAVVNVRAAIERARGRPAWSILRLQSDPIGVAYGCPSPPVLKPSGSVMDRLQRRRVGKQVDVASEYRVFLFVMREVDVQRAFGSDSLYSRAANEEMLCGAAQTESGQWCESVTSGLYLTVSELNDPVARIGFGRDTK
jgi:hypothetical protein